MKKYPIIFSLSIIFSSAISIFAANCYTQMDGNWSDENMWTAIPTVSDNVIIRNNVMADGGDKTFNNLTLSEISAAVTYDGILTIPQGATVKCSGSIAGARNFPVAGNGTLIVDGGNFEGGAMHAGNGQKNNSFSKTILKNGASFHLKRVMNLGGTGGQRGELQVIGSGNTFKVGQLMVRDSGSIEFIADAKGFSTLKSTGRLSYGSAAMTIDGSAYTGPSTTMILLTSESGEADYKTISTSAIITGFPSNYTARLFTEGNDLKLEITAK